MVRAEPVREGGGAEGVSSPAYLESLDACTAVGLAELDRTLGEHDLDALVAPATGLPRRSTWSTATPEGVVEPATPVPWPGLPS